MISKKLSIAFCISFLVILSSCGKADSQDIANTTTEIKVTTEKAVETSETPETSKEETTMYTTESNEETETEDTPYVPLSDSIDIVIEDGKATAGFNSINTVTSLSFYGTDAEQSIKDAIDLIGKMNNTLSVPDAKIDQDHFRIPEKDYSGDLKDLIDTANVYSQATDDYFSTKIKDNDGADSLNIRDIYKGFTANKLAEALSDKTKEELSGALITLGGNITIIGTKPNGKSWKVGIQDPNGEPGSHIAVVSVDEKLIDSFNADSLTVASKGTYSLSNDNSRVIDPKTGEIADSGIVASTVISDDGAMADAFGSAAIVMGYDKAVEFWKDSKYNFEMILIDKSGEIFITEGLKNNYKSDGKINIISKA